MVVSFVLLLWCVRALCVCVYTRWRLCGWAGVVAVLCCCGCGALRATGCCCGGGWAAAVAALAVAIVMGRAVGDDGAGGSVLLG